jgi:hypothetical protein
VCMAGSIAGWAHTKSSFNLSSGNSADKVIALGSSLEEQKSGPTRFSYSPMTNKINKGVTRTRQQPRFRILRDAVLRQVVSAATNALLRASSALATSRVCEERYATRRPYDSRATRSIVR